MATPIQSTAAAGDRGQPSDQGTSRPRIIEGDSLTCVWSHGQCGARIPTSMAVKAWRREMQLTEREEGFFHFPWQNGIWLGYGVGDGSVRGVYCAEHCSERAARLAQR